MNKGEFLDAIAVKSNIPNKTVALVFNSMAEVVTEQLKAGEKISIAGFGSFESRHVAARNARNPKTGEIVKIPEKSVPKFKFGKNVKEALK